MRKTYEIDGLTFDSLEGFWDAISETLIPGVHWGRNFDGFNDILRGGFGTPDEGFILRWKNSSASRERLGYAATVRRLEALLTCCHPASRAAIESDLALATRRDGPTIFDSLVEIIHNHGPAGEASDSKVTLILD